MNTASSRPVLANRPSVTLGGVSSTPGAGAANLPCSVVRALSVKPHALAKAVLYSRWTFCQGTQMPMTASTMPPEDSGHENGH
eukprot:8402768-Pyramimonas_sp.AAC.1